MCKGYRPAYDFTRIGRETALFHRPSVTVKHRLSPRKQQTVFRETLDLHRIRKRNRHTVPDTHSGQYQPSFFILPGLIAQRRHIDRMRRAVLFESDSLHAGHPRYGFYPYPDEIPFAVLIIARRTRHSSPQQDIIQTNPFHNVILLKEQSLRMHPNTDAFGPGRNMLLYRPGRLHQVPGNAAYRYRLHLVAVGTVASEENVVHFALAARQECRVGTRSA